MNRRRILIFLLVICLLALVSIYAPKFNGLTANTIKTQYEKENAILLRVIDGDTIETNVNGEIWTIRMLGINTPEKKMPFSNEGKALLSQFVNKSIVLLRDIEDIDKYNRKLRYVFYNNRFLNREILEQGFANSYYTTGIEYQQELLSAETKARISELGIWQKSGEQCATQNCIQLKELNQFEEFFTINNVCSFDCSLEDWFVKDAGRNTFYLTSLNSNSEQTYNSKNNASVWNNDHDRLFMFDNLGKIVLFYEY